MSWMNKDNLYVKFGREEAMKVSGGDISPAADRYRYEMQIPYTEVQSATKSILGSVANPGAQGVVLPKGFFIEYAEAVAETPFQSSGTIGSSTMQIGLIKASDRSTDYDAAGVTTAAFVGSVFDSQGERVVITTGVTGKGSAIGTTLTEDVIVSVLNSQHPSHPYTTAGVLKLSIVGYYK
jgi:hypothetical protein